GAAQGAADCGGLHGQGRAGGPSLLRLGRHLQPAAAGDRGAAQGAQAGQYRPHPAARDRHRKCRLHHAIGGRRRRSCATHRRTARLGNRRTEAGGASGQTIIGTGKSMTGKNRGWVLESYPVGDDFDAALKLRDVPLPEPGPNQLLVRSLYLSLDPANRGWMMMPTYIPQVPLGATMWGFVLGRVEKSNIEGFKPGDLVSGFGAWADYCLIDAQMANRVPDLGGLPLYAAQSLFGLSGGTAYVGVLDVAQAKAGEVFLISGAAGSVGA